MMPQKRVAFGRLPGAAIVVTHLDLRLPSTRPSSRLTWVSQRAAMRVPLSSGPFVRMRIWKVRLHIDRACSHDPLRLRLIARCSCESSVSGWSSPSFSRYKSISCSRSGLASAYRPVASRLSTRRALPVAVLMGSGPKRRTATARSFLSRRTRRSGSTPSSN
jgi:hypothetical protein